MKIYTKTGDQGETSLFSGKRVLKANSWVMLYGGLDELNSDIGLLTAKLGETPDFKNLVASLHAIQSNLFSLGSYYASEATKDEHVENIDKWVSELEASMDKWEESLAPLKNFILPGGSFESALTHKARVKARAIERELVASGLEPAMNTVVYLNRLSDYFFVLARHLNLLLKHEDVLWTSGV